MKILKAVITAAGPGQRYLPLQVVKTQAGHPVTALHLLLDEVFSSGIETAAIIIAAGDSKQYAKAAGPHADKVTFIEQNAPRGYGHAVWCAKDFVGQDPYLLMVSDHLYLSHTNDSCIKQVLETARIHECSVSAVQATRESQLPLYGAIGGTRVPQSRDLYEIKTVLEKPSPTLAEQHLIVPGLRSGQYLCFFGMHALPASSMKALSKTETEAETFGITKMLNHLSDSEQHLAYQVDGQRFNLEAENGLLLAQLALALNSSKRDTLLSSIIELLATTR